MAIIFYKYQGAGNDFIMINNRQGIGNSLNLTQRQFLCDRKFGIGADGLILINNHPDADFEMLYFNADGNIGSLCGNGSRCAVAFAKFLNIIDTQCRFMASDGIHIAENVSDNFVKLKMGDVDSKRIKKIENDYEIDTGSPHYIKFFQSDISEINVVEEGRKIRNNATYKEKGINVNFIQKLAPNQLVIRTYERGVENETLACGTGATATAIAYAFDQGLAGSQSIDLQALGGKLNVSFDMSAQECSNVFLSGGAQQVFKGEIDPS